MFAIFNTLAEALWLYLPALVANSVPVFVGKSTFLAPYRRPIWQVGLGANKSWAGLIIGVFVGTFAGWLQITLTSWPSELWIWIGWSALISLGALIGDATKSFFKRRIGIAPGSAWPVIDGIDYVVGALLFGLPLFVPTWEIALALLIAGPILSLLANVCAYMIGLKKVWY